MKICPMCQQRMMDSFKVCGRCGASLDIPEKAAEPVVKKVSEVANKVEDAVSPVTEVAIEEAAPEPTKTKSSSKPRKSRAKTSTEKTSAAKTSTTKTSTTKTSTAKTSTAKTSTRKTKTTTAKAKAAPIEETAAPVEEPAAVLDEEPLQIPYAEPIELTYEEPAETSFEEPAAIPEAEDIVMEETFEEPVYEEPVAEEPVAEEPVFEEPVIEEPVIEEPVAAPVEEAAPVRRSPFANGRKSPFASMASREDFPADRFDEPEQPVRTAPKKGKTPPSRRAAAAAAAQEAEQARGQEEPQHRGLSGSSDAASSSGSGESLSGSDYSQNYYSTMNSGEKPAILGGYVEEKKEDNERFVPIPPFMSAEEVSRPSPFAPMKPGTLDMDDKESEKDTRKAPAAQKTPAPSRRSQKESGAIELGTRTCPICNMTAFSTEENCKGCGYRFPKSGALGLSEKNINVLAMLASLAMGLSVFVNFITFSLNGVQQEIALINKVDGFAFLALAALGLVLGYFGRNGGVMAIGILSSLAVAVEDYMVYYDITQVKKGGNIDSEIGFYLLAAGAILVLIAGIVGLVKARKKEMDKLKIPEYPSPYR